ncbi:tape measure protein [Lachnoclostridium phytofermentans]|uniref:tape measure protein n=1 Tax=Lachnoclostridium phytofermentans TaxID=66219 RepID=UPI000497730C|nr:tape measure protein [Lachnoclostridium phytofermentans]
MGRDVSIAISAKDNFSQAITTMRNANQGFNKDLTGLQSKLNELNKTKAILKVDTDKAKASLKDAEKQFIKTGDAADKLNLELANSNYENARRNLSLVSDNAKKAEKDMRSLADTVSKSENRASNTGSSGNSIINSLAASGATKMVGDMFGNVATTWINSAYGAEAGTMASSMLSSGAMGAAIGTAIAPGIGTAIGALGGAVIGYINGSNTIYENKDEAFKKYYNELYSGVLDNQSQALTSGSGIASGREMNKISFQTLLGKSEANKYLKSLVQFGMDTPFEYDSLVDISKVLLAYGYKQDEILPLLEKVGNTGSALSMSVQDMKFVSTALGRMKTTGKTTMEYLNPLLERGIDVWSYLAEASGKTKKEVQEMVSKGLVPGEKAAKAIADYMGYNFAGNMEKQAQTYSGLISTLEDAKAELNNSMGEGYNNTRKKGIEDEINFLEGNTGDSMKEAYNKIGQWKAYQENQAEQFQRDVMSSVMSGELASSLHDSEQRAAVERLMKEYSEAKKKQDTRYRSYDEESAIKAGAEMGRVLAEAQAIATNEYNASEGAQLALESNKTLAENLKNDTASLDAYWDAGYVMGQEFTKGLSSAIQEGSSITAPKGDIYQPAQPPVNNRGGYAFGLSNVPYNNYPAYLHEGERVLTASENRSYSAGTPPIKITGNTFVVRNDSDFKGVAREIASLIKQAFILAQ